MLWQHLFWFFGHPEVYIVALPFFGIVTEVIPVFSRTPLFGYKGMVAATIAIAAYSMTVWAHHMYATGQVLLPFFSFMTFLIAVFAGVYFWFPKRTGRMLDDRLGKVHFWLTFIGFHTTFLVQHWLGAMGMPRRYADYRAADGFTTLNMVSSIGAFVLGASMLPFLWNVWKSYRIGEPAGADDPWGFGHSLEWATSC